ncbi:MAG: hypothetical protein R2762_01095 [Bryobacteraceae bacterium]
MFAQTDVQRNREFYFQGAPYDRFDHFWNVSPLKYIKNAKTLTLIHVVEGDLGCRARRARNSTWRCENSAYRPSSWYTREQHPRHQRCTKSDGEDDGRIGWFERQPAGQGRMA